jgi:hypothetical protein
MVASAGWLRSKTVIDTNRFMLIKIPVICLALSLLLSGCSSYGYHPHYIISHDETAQEEGDTLTR